MQSFIDRRLVGVSVAAACALWCTRATLDVASSDGGASVRIAMLPSPLELLAIMAVTGFACWGWTRLLDRASGSPRPIDGSADAAAGGSPNDSDAGATSPTSALLPLAASVVLMLPYAPVAADAAPVLRVLAGPAKYLVWFIVVVLTAWASGEYVWARRGRAANDAAAQASDGAGAGRPRFGALTVFTVGAVIFLGVSARLTRTPVFPGGDEPHYLVIAQSLWRDRDFKIENNHTRGDYLEYFNRPLAPHYLVRGVDREIYSIHPVGLPILAAPIYAVAGYRGVVFALVLMGAAAGALMWRAAAEVTGSVAAASAAWAAVCLGTPYAVNTITVYPEIPAGLAVMIVVVLTLLPSSAAAFTTQRAVIVGILTGLLPWFSTKYAPLAATLWAISAWRILSPDAVLAPSFTPRARTRLLALSMPFAALLAAWFWFFWWIWGSPDPSSPYGALAQTRLSHLRVSGLGLFFDQEYGIFIYAPALLASIFGYWMMVRAGGASRRIAVETLLAFAALTATVGAFRIWWGGDAAPGRPLFSGLALLGVPIAVRLASGWTDVRRRAAAVLVTAIGAAIALALVFGQNGALIGNDRRGSSALLTWLSPDWRLWALAPSYMFHTPLVAASFTAVWMALAAAAGRVIWMRVRTGGGARTSRDSAGAAALWSFGVTAATLLIGAGIIPMAFGRVMQPDVDVRARARSPLLDSFDAQARPLAIVYDPWRRIQASQAPALTAFVARRGERRPPQALRMLFNARYALPAGQYRAQIHFDRAIGSIAGDRRVRLRVTRGGQTLRTYDAPDPDGAEWSGTFTLPVDANFIGFEVSPEMEAAALDLTIHPIAAVDLSRRLEATPALALGTYGDIAAFVHDESAWLEPTGFWTRGSATSRVTLAQDSARPITMRLRAGAGGNHVTLAAGGWRQQIDLSEGAEKDVVVPASASGSAATLSITTDAGFAPNAADPTSRDARFLGCWVQFL